MLGGLPGLGEQFRASPLFAIEAFERPPFMFNVTCVMYVLFMFFFLSPLFLLLSFLSLSSGLLLVLSQYREEGSALADFNGMGTDAWTTLIAVSWPRSR